MSDMEKLETEPSHPKVGAKAFFMKDGEFSKTAAFATMANFFVLLAYVLSWFAGSELVLLDGHHLQIPAFDEGAAVTLLSILNGTYIGNNIIKYKKDSVIK